MSAQLKDNFYGDHGFTEPMEEHTAKVLDFIRRNRKMHHIVAAESRETVTRLRAVLADSCNEQFTVTELVNNGASNNVICMIPHMLSVIELRDPVVQPTVFVGYKDLVCTGYTTTSDNVMLSAVCGLTLAELTQFVMRAQRSDGIVIKHMVKTRLG